MEWWEDEANTARTIKATRAAQMIDSLSKPWPEGGASVAKGFRWRKNKSAGEMQALSPILAQIANHLHFASDVLDVEA